MSMFKVTLKLLGLSLVVFAASLVVSQGKALAGTCDWAPGNPNNGGPAMGFNKGEGDDNFAGLVVKAQVGRMTNGAVDDSGHNNWLVPISYQLHSRLPDISPGTHYYNPAGSSNINARIFTLNANGQPVDRTDTRTFRTDETLYSPGNQNPGFSCVGFSALGPGTDNTEIGNRFGIDCGQEVLRDGTNAFIQKNQTQYWIDNIPNAYGQDGYWEVQILNTNGSVATDIDTRNGQESFYNQPFSVGNGTTKYVNLIWHKEPQRTGGGGDLKSECTYLDVTDGGGATINSKYFDHGNIRTLVRVTDDSGQVMVHGSGGQADFVYMNDESKNWSYTPRSPTVHVYVFRQYYHNTGTKDSNGNWIYAWDNIPAGSKDDNGNPLTGNQSRDHYNCYSATCAPVQVFGNVPDPRAPSNGVVQYSTFAIKMKVTNTGPVTLYSPTLNGTGVSNAPLGQGDTGYAWFYPTAPGNAQNWTIGFTLNDIVANLATCSVTVPVYQSFTAGLGGSGVSLSPTKENPTNAHYDTSVSVSPSSPSVYIPTTGMFYELPASGGQTNLVPYSGGIYPPSAALVGDWHIGSVNAGDKYCVTLHADYTTGLIGPNGPYDVYATSTPADYNPPCDKVINQPYTHFQGSDVSAGGGFGKSCMVTEAGNISTYNESPGGVSAGGNGGSGAQFGAEAMNIISGLTSASLRSNAPTALNGLTFANNDPHIGGSPPAQTNGGYMGGGSNFCVPDYFGDKPPSLSTPDTSISATAGSGNAQQYYKPAGGTLTLNGGTIANAVNQTIFVEGNVTISGNISYDSAARASIHDIPSFYLVVKNGNVHINPGVTRLDGVYVAQPDTTSPTTIAKTGIINTCWNAADTDPNHVYNNCKNQLVVNGAFVANKVLLTRSYSSLRYSKNGEHNLGGYAAHSCGNAGFDVPPTGPASASDCAAEIFNFNPELYMSQPGISPSYGAASGKYDAITSLWPTL